MPIKCRAHLLEASVAFEDAVSTVAVRGELDIATRSILDDALTQAIELGASIVLVDLAELSFIDATGLGALVSARNRLLAQSRDLTLRNPSPVITSMIAAIGLTDLLDGGGRAAVGGG